MICGTSFVNGDSPIPSIIEDLIISFISDLFILSNCLYVINIGKIVIYAAAEATSIPTSAKTIASDAISDKLNPDLTPFKIVSVNEAASTP